MDPKTRIATYERLIDNLTEQPEPNGRFTPEQLVRIRPTLVPKDVVFLAFPPKAAGTFLRRTLAELLQTDLLIRGSYASGDQERDLYYPQWLHYMMLPEAKPGVAHCHCTANTPNLELMALFGLRPVVMVRNIADMLASYADMAADQGGVEQFGTVAAVPGFFELDADTRKDFLVHNLAPWYIKFYASWFNAATEDTGVPILFVAYDDLRRRPRELVSEILEHSRIRTAGADAIDAALGHSEQLKAQLRFNRGASGRGRDMFEPEHHAHLRRLAMPYGHIDWEALGLLYADA